MKFSFLLVVTNQHFKLPIAYYFTDRLNSREKAKLLKTILYTLYNKSINVVSITFNGAPSNISMCEEMGARLKHVKIEEIKPFFVHLAEECKLI